MAVEALNDKRFQVSRLVEAFVCNRRWRFLLKGDVHWSQCTAAAVIAVNAIAAAPATLLRMEVHGGGRMAAPIPGALISPAKVAVKCGHFENTTKRTQQQQQRQEWKKIRE